MLEATQISLSTAVGKHHSAMTAQDGNYRTMHKHCRILSLAFNSSPKIFFFFVVNVNEAIRICLLLSLLTTVKNFSFPMFQNTQKKDWWLIQPQQVGWLSQHGKKQKLTCGLPNISPCSTSILHLLKLTRIQENPNRTKTLGDHEGLLTLCTG